MLINIYRPVRHGMAWYVLVCHNSTGLILQLQMHSSMKCIVLKSKDIPIVSKVRPN